MEPGLVHHGKDREKDVANVKEFDTDNFYCQMGLLKKANSPVDFISHYRYIYKCKLQFNILNENRKGKVISSSARQSLS